MLPPDASAVFDEGTGRREASRCSRKQFSQERKTMRRLISLLTFLLVCSPVFAQQNTTRFFVAYGDENLTVSSTAVAFTSTEILDANNSINRAAMVSFKISCATLVPRPVVLRYEGTDADTSNGHPFDEGDSARLYGYDNISNASWIRTGSNDATVYVTYHR